VPVMSEGTYKALMRHLRGTYELRGSYEGPGRVLVMSEGSCKLRGSYEGSGRVLVMSEDRCDLQGSYELRGSYEGPWASACYE